MGARRLSKAEAVSETSDILSQLAGSALRVAELVSTSAGNGVDERGRGLARRDIRLDERGIPLGGDGSSLAHSGESHRRRVELPLDERERRLDRCGIHLGHR
jgi:hypothetical protein